MNLFKRALILLTLQFCGLAFAQTCSFWNEVQFPDGSKECLSKYPLGAVIPQGYNIPLIDVPRGQVTRGVAVSVGESSCPLVAGVGFTQSAGAPPAAMALASCEAGLRARSVSPGPSCGCQYVIEAGVSRVPKIDFDRIAGASRSLAGPDQAAAPKNTSAAVPGEVQAGASTPAIPKPFATQTASQSCGFWNEVQFPDGSKECLSKYSLGSMIPQGYTAPLVDLPRGQFGRGVAISVGGASCPLVMGVGYGNNAGSLNSATAIPACELALKSKSVAPGADCNCRMVVNMGVTTFQKAEFERIVDASRSALPVATQAATPPPASPVQVAAAAPSAAKAPIPSETLAALPPRPAAATAPAAPVATPAQLAPATPAPPAKPTVVESSPAKAAPPAELPVFANRRALVIGNDSYRNVSKLVNAREDARAIAKSLEQVGYQVTLKFDLTEKEMKSTLRSFRGQVEGGDEVMFFYAGHGVQIGAANYLLPIDVNAESEDQIKDDGIMLQRILDDMTERKAKLTLAMIDACRDNPFKGSGRAIGGRGLAPTTAATGQMIVFSAGSGQQALDKLGANDTDKNGLFTRMFIKEMQKPGLTVDRVVRNVRTGVVNLAKSVGHEQVPAIYDQVVGEFYFRAP